MAAPPPTLPLLICSEAEQLPPTHKRAAEQVDEMTVAWVLVPFHSSVSLTKPQTMTLPLMCGPLLQGEELSKLQDDAHKKKCARQPLRPPLSSDPSLPCLLLCIPSCNPEQIHRKPLDPRKPPARLQSPRSHSYVHLIEALSLLNHISS